MGDTGGNYTGEMRPGSRWPTSPRRMALEWLGQVERVADDALDALADAYPGITCTTDRPREVVDLIGICNWAGAVIDAAPGAAPDALTPHEAAKELGALWPGWGDPCLLYTSDAADE